MIPQWKLCFNATTTPGGIHYTRTSLFSFASQATAEIMNAYENKTTMAHQSDTYMVGMTRLIRPVKTLA